MNAVNSLAIFNLSRRDDQIHASLETSSRIRACLEISREGRTNRIANHIKGESSYADWEQQVPKGILVEPTPWISDAWKSREEAAEAVSRIFP